MNDNGIFEKNLQSFRIKRRYGDKAQCTCPAHDDKHASLTITKGQRCTLFHCHAGCTLDDILRAAGLEKKETFYDIEPRSPNWKSYVEARKKKRIESIYDYRNINSGNYEYTKIRFEGKEFTYGILENDRFSFGLNGLQRKSIPAMYCRSFTGFKEAVEEGKPVFYVEGEKDVNTLYSKGYAAVTCGAAGDWSNVCIELFRGADVVVFADNDREGVKLAYDVKSDLQSVAKSIKVVLPCPEVEHGDVSDYFAAGHSKEEFEKLIQDEFKESIADNEFKENKEFKRKPGELDRFHLFNNGKITGVFDYEIFRYLKSKHDLFILGGTPYLYEGGVYVADDSGAKLKTLIRDLIYPAYVKSTTIKRVYELFITAAELQVTFEDVNQYPPFWICFKNGFWDCKNRKLLPHDPKYRCINQIACNFDPDLHPDGTAMKNWLDFICAKRDDREMLLEFIGYSMTRDTSQQHFLVLNGLGGTGKSTLIRLLESLIGNQNISNISMTEFGQRFASIGILGKLLNSCADLEVGCLDDVSLIKKLLGEDLIRGEAKGRDAISFKSFAKLVFSTNQLPLIKNEQSNGFYRRLLILTMDKKPQQNNPNLFDELCQDLDYLLNQAVEAVGRMYDRGTILISESSEKAVHQLWYDSDTVQAFLNDMCVQDIKDRTERTELYEHYIRYCEETDRQGLTKNNLYKSLRVKGYREIKTGGYRYFEGISLMKNCPKSALETALDDFITVTEEEMKDIPFD